MSSPSVQYLDDSWLNIDPGWYFFDEQSNAHGPFETECEAINELKKYVLHL